MSNSCPLCRREKLTEWLWDDEICWVAKCITCGGWQIILNHHGEPTPEELEHLKTVSQKLFPNAKWRGVRRVIKDHWHEHLI